MTTPPTNPWTIRVIADDTEKDLLERHQSSSGGRMMVIGEPWWQKIGEGRPQG